MSCVVRCDWDLFAGCFLVVLLVGCGSDFADWLILSVLGIVCLCFSL